MRNDIKVEVISDEFNIGGNSTLTVQYSTVQYSY
jgi:hypothetical protein